MPFSFSGLVDKQYRLASATDMPLHEGCFFQKASFIFPSLKILILLGTILVHLNPRTQTKPSAHLIILN